MTDINFSCIRCGLCCKASIPLGLAEALEYDADFLLALVFGVETWNIDAFAKNRPVVPITHEELLTTLAFRKDKLAMEASRDTVFQVGKLQPGGERVASFVSVTACGLGSWLDGGPRCPALSDENACTIYERRPLGCRVFPLDPVFPEMLQSVPLLALKGRLPCDFSQDAPTLWSEGKVTDVKALAHLKARQERLRHDSLFLPFYAVTQASFAPLPGYRDILKSLAKGGKMDVPFFPALVYLVTSGETTADRAELCLARQSALARAEVDAAMERRDKAERGRTAVLRNCVALMDAARGRIGEMAGKAENCSASEE